MTNAILVHGWNTEEEFFDQNKPTASNDHWFPWLTKQLMVKGIKVDAPEMPQYTLSTYESWKKEFERFDILPDTILIGHSCGAGFILRYLSECESKFGKVYLVAPWLGLNFGHEFNADFFSFDFDENLARKTNGITLISSDDDFDVIHDSIKIIKDNVNEITYLPMQGKGHFTRTSLGTDAFPELLKEVLA